MFPKKERLPRAQFPAVLKSGKRLSSPHFMVIISRDARGYAVILPKKVTNLSVTRHKIKRRVLAALRVLTLPPALILFPKTSISSVSYQDIQAEIKKLIS